MSVRITLSIFAVFLSNCLSAQIINGQDTLYGNEWIQFGQPYFKILVAENGVYRLTGQTLGSAGVSGISGSDFQLFHNGEEVPVYVSSNSIFTDSDFLEFYGKKNTAELDRHLYLNPDEEMMNPRFSLITDTAAYFLTWNPSVNPKRYVDTPNDLTNLPPKEAYFMAVQEQVFSNAFGKKSNSQGVSLSEFTVSEGFSNGYANLQNIPIAAPPGLLVGGPSGKLTVRYAGNIGQHQQLITLNDQPLATDEYFDFLVRQPNFEVPNGTMTAAMTLKFQGLVSSTDRQRVAFVQLEYPRQFDFANQKSFPFQLPASSALQYLEIENFNAGGSPPVLYDLTNGWRLVGELENNLVKIALPPSTFPRELVLVNYSDGFKPVGQLVPVDFVDYQAVNAEFILLSNQFLFDDGNGNNYVQQYADYRSSAAGGGYATVVVEIQQLYDQFGWGINRHPLSIRNFSHFVNKKWDNPQYLFIIGKGREYDDIRSNAGLTNPAHLPMMVPTFGRPGSDNLLTATKTNLKPTIPTGRYPAVTGHEVKIYLDKIKQFDANKNLPQTIEDRQWMKRVMHLGGGGPDEQAVIRSHLESIGEILESNSFGAEVHAFYKTSADPIQVSQTQEITDLINTGLSIITLFGHASANGFDFTVDDPANYSNSGKYPLMLSLGCFSGQIHDNFRSVGERFVLQENKGTIGFLASTGYGYVHALSQMTKSFFGEFGGNGYGKGVGYSLGEAIETVLQSDFGTMALAHQFTLNGDPSVVLNAFETPDFMPNPQTVMVDPAQINAQMDTFNFSFEIANIGKAISDSIWVELTRELPSGSQILLERRQIPSPKYSDLLKFSVPVLGDLAVGFNKLLVKIDPENLIEEQMQPEAESNNNLIAQNGETGHRFYVFSNGAIPVFPTEFSIVSNADLKLKASTSNVFAPEQRYFFEIDTTAHFNSPFKKSATITQSGGVVEWQPGNVFSDNTVYYWRVAPDSVGTAALVWGNSSFLFKNDIPAGWNQSHFFQLKKDQFVNIELPEATRQFKFIDDFKTIRMEGGVFPTFYPQWYFGEEYYYYLNASPAVTGGVYISVFDSLTADSWYNAPPGLYGSLMPNGFYFPLFPFPTQTEQQREKVINFLRDTVPSGSYVMFVTIQYASGSNYEPAEWAADSLLFGTNIFQLLETQGATQLRSTAVSGAKPYVAIYRKDDPSFPTKEKMSPLNILLEENASLPGLWTNGYLESTLIGPSLKWDSLVWHSTHFDSLTDQQRLDVYGIKSDNSKTLLFENVQETGFDLSTISADEYPYLRLRYQVSDSTEQTSPQLQYWRVYYQGLPDAAIDPSAGFTFSKDTLQEGENLLFATPVRNLTTYGMDSILVKYSIIDAQNQMVERQLRFAPLPEEGEIQAVFQLNTKDIRGHQQLWMEVNPNKDQPELHAFNNVAVRRFYVETDQRNPLLDVTFDGMHILNGDLVSSKPYIVIRLKDENPYLALNDTSLFKVFLQYPDTSQLVEVPFDGGLMKFTSANLQTGENTAQIELNPHFTKDGVYTLIVQSRDVSNNAAGQYDHKIAFEVITKSTISNLLNYPNPFSSSTRFVYTLTGEEPPAQFKIQIVTVAGRIVREITQDEIGPLRIGTHQTDYAWDGKDEFGDQLANGVYLYRVIAKKANGEEFQLSENAGADKYFTNGYGKMVLVR